MKIYFIASNKGSNTERGEEIVGLLSEYGEVLVGSTEEMDPGYAYERDTEWIQEAEVVVAEVSAENTGVGYEIGLAEALEKRILCLFCSADGEQPSPIVVGNRKLSVAEYETMEDIDGIFKDFF
jgi:nucleoside 2-deoxyribosyltransferase